MREERKETHHLQSTELARRPCKQRHTLTKPEPLTSKEKSDSFKSSWHTGVLVYRHAWTNKCNFSKLKTWQTGLRLRFSDGTRLPVLHKALDWTPECQKKKKLN